MFLEKSARTYDGSYYQENQKQIDFEIKISDLMKSNHGKIKIQQLRGTSVMIMVENGARARIYKDLYSSEINKKKKNHFYLRQSI